MLAGDAAHVTNPVGGLGLTGGFLDAFVLYEALAAVIVGDAGGDILDVYSERRRQALTTFRPFKGLRPSLGPEGAGRPQRGPVVIRSMRAWRVSSRSRRRARAGPEREPG